MVKLSKHTKTQKRNPGDDKDRKLYRLHHVHHIKTTVGAKHELHHCVLYDRKNLAGRMYEINHVKKGESLLHCLKKKFSGKLYDHANKPYKIAESVINDKKRYVIQL